MDYSQNLLTSLPGEIFGLVSEFLLPSPIPTLVSYPPKSLVYAEPLRPELDCWAAWEVEQINLLNFALASSQCRDYCERYLWRSVIFRSVNTLTVLTTTLAHRSHLGQHVRSIYVLIPPFSLDEKPYPEEQMNTLIGYTSKVEDIFFSPRHDCFSGFSPLLSPFGSSPVPSSTTRRERW